MSNANSSPTPAEQLLVDTCGLQKCTPGHSYGPAVRNFYLIHCVFSGQGRYHVDGHQYEISSGQGFIIHPQIITTYVADSTNPWQYGWIGYSGSTAQQLSEQIGLSRKNPVFSISQPERVRNLIRQTEQDIAQLRLGSLSATGNLLQIMALIGEENDLSGFDADSANPYYLRALWYIGAHLEEAIRVEDVAYYVGICRSQLFRVFKQECNLSPQQSIAKIRMKRARQLLSEAKLSMHEIALSCGYASSARMGQAFKQHHKLTPSQFQKQQLLSKKHKNLHNG